jgi:HSP20 family molecular chaperone IbpA
MAMSSETRTELQRTENNNAPAVPEQTRPGPVYTPAVDIFENEERITVLADLPGVSPEGLTIDLRQNVLTLTGHVNPSGADGESPVLAEYAPGTFFRQFALGETIEQERIEARLAQGVLRLELPKAERSRPRQIQVRTR